MPNPRIVLTFEGFSPAALGCYGSSWNRTPLIDSIAGNGSVWDRCITTSDNPDESLQTIVSQILSREDADGDSVEMLTDVQSIADGSVDPYFDRIEVINSERRTEPATDVIETQLGQLFASAIQRDSEPMPWQTLWIHSGFLTRQWDAPRNVETSDSILDEQANGSDNGPPLMFDSVEPPMIELNGDEHPDLVTSWMRTYASQIHTIDLLLEMLLDSIQYKQTQVVIAGVSGFRFGQGRWIGHRCGPLRSRDVHVPFLTSSSSPIRHTRMTSIDLAAGMIGRETINDTTNRRPNNNTDNNPRLAIRSDRSQMNCLTDDWFFVRDQDSTEHLYSKPDDIDDFNDVARIRPDIVAQLDAQ